jgi:O-antigen/teichoic acid export membrane protein
MSLKKRALSGIFWTFTENFSVQLLNFAIQIILARLLLPEDFGLIAMLTVFINIGHTLVNGGMTTSIIRTKKPDQNDFSTVFITNILVSFFIYFIVFLLAPIIADFYNQPILKDILRVFALSFVIRSFVAVHIAKLNKEMNFKQLMKIQLPSTLIGGFIGVAMAYNGYGVWSLVWMILSQTLVYTLQNWFLLPWRPSLIFDKNKFNYHFNFGYKMTLSGLLDTVYNNSYNIIIGKFFSPAIVGFYSQAENLRLFPVSQLSNVVDKVTYPLFSEINNDIQLKDVYKNVMKASLSVVIPIMLVLIVVAQEVFLFVFGEKWLPAVPFFQILAIASIVRPISNYNLNILKVKGRSDLFLKVEVIKKILGVIAIAVALPFGIIPLVVSLTVVSYFFVGINMFYSGNLINYPMTEQISNIFRLYLIGIVAMIVTYFFKLHFLETELNNLITIAITGLFYLVLYVSGIYFLEKNMIQIVKQLVR